MKENQFKNINAEWIFDFIILQKIIYGAQPIIQIAGLNAGANPMNLLYLFLSKLTRIRSFFHITPPKPLRSKMFVAVDLFSYSQNQLLPPFELRHQLGQDECNGEFFVQSLRSLCDLKPDESILDVGCGCGRVALPLTRYMEPQGRYEGLEIVPAFVNWCQQHISSRYPNFHFVHADIFSGAYNPKGTFKAAEYKFPYRDDSFDVVFLSSVFTHMLPKDVENYLSQVTRVIKKNGRCWVSYFLLDADGTRRAGSLTTVRFMDTGEYYTTDRDVPEKAVGYKENTIRKLYEKNKLEIMPPIHYNPNGQDIIIARKTV